ncbi:MAG: hypothetical protein WBA76_02935 [Phormidesmis sp.]
MVSLFGCSASELMGGLMGERVEAIAPTDPSIQIQQTNSLMISVANTSNIEMKNIVITYDSLDNSGSNQFHSQPEAYGDLAPGEVTDYHTVGASYSYAPMEATIKGKRIRLGVTDFVGESLIPNGNYTYNLAYDPSALYTYNGLSGQLKYNQTTLDSEIDRALTEEITEDIFDEYYGEYGKNKVFWLNCVHQQTHRKDSEGSSPAIIYANVICIEPYFQSAPGEEIKKLNAIPQLPMRFELRQENSSFSVTDYQFPRKAPWREKDIKKIFSSRAIEEMENAEIREDTYNKLRLKSGREF